MARRTSIRNSTVLLTLKSQKDEILTFNKNLDMIDKYINTKVTRTLKLESEGCTKIQEITPNNLLFQNLIHIKRFNIDSSIEETFTFPSEVLTYSLSKDKILVLFSDSFRILDFNFNEIFTIAYDIEFKCGVIKNRGKGIVTGDVEGNLCMWDLINEELDKSVLAHECGITQVGFSELQKFVVSLGQDRVLKVWDKKLQLLMQTDAVRSKNIMEVVNEYIFFSDRVLKIGENEVFTHFELFKQSIQFQVGALAVSKDNKYFAVYDNKLSVYEFGTNILRFKCKCKVTDPTYICFSIDGFRVYVSNGNRVEVIKLFEDFGIKNLKLLRINPIFMVSHGSHVYLTDSYNIYHYEDSSKDLNKVYEAKKMLIIAQNDISKTSVIKKPLTISSYLKSERSIELPDTANRGSSTERESRNRGVSHADRTTIGFSLKEKKISSKIYGKKFSLLIMSDQSVEIFDGDDNEGTIIHSGGNLSILEANSEAFLVYDKVEVKVYELYTFAYEIFSLMVTDLKAAALGQQSEFILLMFENYFELHNIKTRENSRFTVIDLMKVDFFGSSSKFYAVSRECFVQVYETGDQFPLGSFQVENKVFTGTAHTSRSIYLLLSSDAGIEICSLQDYCYLATIPICNLTTFSLSIREKKIYYCCSNVLFSMNNPLETSSFEPLLLNFTEFSFDIWKWISTLINNDRSLGSQTSAHKDFVIMPFCISQVLLLSNSGQKLLLKKAIRSGCTYLRYQNPTLSPLTVAICRRNKDIIASLMKEIIYAASLDPNVFSRVEDDLIELNYKGSNRNLSYFYENIFYTPSHEYDSLAVLKTQPFVALLSSTTQILNSNFLIPSYSGSDLVEFRVSSIRFKIDEFTHDSVEFLDSIIWSSSPEILKTPIIQAILLHKWKSVEPLIYFQLAVFASHLFILTLFASSARNELFVVIVLSIFNTFFMLCEIPLILHGPINYIFDPWNVLDSGRILISYFFYIVFFFADDHDTLLENLCLLVIVLLSWIRGLAFFRIFKRTRYLIGIILEVFIDVIPFIIVLFYCIMSFAFVGYSLDVKFTFVEPENAYWQLVDEWSIQYLLNFGDIDTDGYTFVDWIQFFGSSILNTLIMMSMIIALMGNTYERVQELAVIAEYKEMASYILEIESMLLWLQLNSKKKYFQFCFSRTQLEIGEEEEIIDEKIKKIKEKVVSFASEFQVLKEETEKSTLECKDILDSSLEQSSKQIEEIFTITRNLNDQIKSTIKTPRISLK